MLQTITVERSTLGLLKMLQQIPSLETTRLVGGTALALQLGHRFSIDLDFFGIMESPIEQLLQELDYSGMDIGVKYGKGSIKVLYINGVKVDIVNYPYDWIEAPIETEGVRMAGLKDIAAMKLSAITNRGTKKDFIDIYFLLQQFSLETMMGFYEQKYAHGSPFNVIRSLSYFEDAEDDPMPKLFHPIDWEEIKATIRLAIEKY
ncbi:nucleotidyl transferase AbiEii/AbiGii toxin family protein [Bacteroidales bacterium OttesenSCG-928-L03]|nr:nucleotidyl transferase AbiEii/AbiGii toxin family protein [Bacteroidales bacterium OttesenSCG-928-L03]